MKYELEQRWRFDCAGRYLVIHGSGDVAFVEPAKYCDRCGRNAWAGIELYRLEVLDGRWQAGDKREEPELCREIEVFVNEHGVPWDLEVAYEQ